MIYIDLATDPRAAQLRHNLSAMSEAMLELLERPDTPELETKYADLKDYRKGDTEREIKASERARASTVRIKQRIIQSIATDGYNENWDPIRCALKSHNGQLNLIGGGSHRTSSLLALNMPVPAILVDPTNEFKP